MNNLKLCFKISENGWDIINMIRLICMASIRPSYTADIS